MAEAPAAAPDAAAAAAAPPAKSKKMLIIIIAAVVVLVGGGVGAYFAFGSKGDEEQTAEEGKAGAKDKKAKKAEAAKPKGPAIYVKLDPPFVVNFEAKGVMRFLQVTVEIMTRDAHVADVVKANDPMIRNDLLLLFGNQQSGDITTLEGKEKLRADALATVAKIVTAEGGEGKKVEQLFFTSFVMQ